MLFSALLVALRADIWPAGEAVNLRTAHNGYFKAALADIQKEIEELQVLNTTSYSRCDRLWKDGMSAVEQPNGVIRMVYSIVNNNWRDWVGYQSRSYQEVLERSKQLFCAETPSTEAAQGNGFFLEEEAVDSEQGRARDGWWAIYRRIIYIAPWMQVNEKLIIEWDGIKTEYADNDVVSDTVWTRDVLEAVKLYVLWQHEWYFGDKREALAHKAAYWEKRADLIVDFRQRRIQKNDKTIPDAVLNLTSDAIADDDDAAEDPTADEDCGDEPTLPSDGADGNTSEALSGVFSGEGSPEGTLAKCVGSIYTDIEDPDHPITWKKTSGGCTSTGWVQELSI
jgi:hypothetical protein